MSVIHEQPEKRLDARALVFPILLGACLIVLFLRLWYFQVAQASELSERAQSSQTRSYAKLAPRGLIYDRKGKLIAGVRSEIVIAGIPAELKKHPNVLHRVASILGQPQEDLEKIVEKEYKWRPYAAVPLFVGATVEQATRIGEANANLPGISVESQPMRNYLNPVDWAHILGYVSVPNSNDVERLKTLGQEEAQFVGKNGLEFNYDNLLLGKVGREEMQIDIKGKPVRTTPEEEPIPGNKLYVAIDADLQKVALDSLAATGKPGAVVALDPATGEILALASYPSFDISWYLGGISQEHFDQLNSDPGKPQINRAIAGRYSPGSTFKIVDTIAARQLGLLSFRESVFCDGGFEIGNRRVRCTGHHGSQDFHNAMAHSCNEYFCTIGMRVKRASLCQTAYACGLGKPTGIDLRGEKSGVVPSEEYYSTWKNPPTWYPGMTANMSIGQGELSATPLQMACVAALVANRGTSYKPHLLKAVQETAAKAPEPVAPQPLAHIDLPDSDWNQLIIALEEVIRSGTARRAQINGITWAGKTGSTEFRQSANTHAWFVGFAPSRSPKIAIAVVIENAGHGGDIAAPVAAKVVKQFLLPPSSRKPEIEIQGQEETPATIGPSPTPLGP